MSRQYTLQRAPSAAAIHIDYAAELNEQQLAAVTAPPGPLLVIAGAGSGKDAHADLSRGLSARERDRSAQHSAAHLHEQSRATDARSRGESAAGRMPAESGAGRFIPSAIACCGGTASALGYSSGFTIHGSRRSEGFDQHRSWRARGSIRRRCVFRKAMCSRTFSVSSSTRSARWRNCSRRSFRTSCR